jgi:hypothetical protein
MLHPTPSTAYTFYYKCDLLPNALSEDNPYPLGGAAHAETILASCLAKAEIERDGAKGTKWGEFMDHLLTSVSFDRKVAARQSVGFNRDWSDPPREGGGHRDYVRDQGVRVSVGGVYPS